MKLSGFSELDKELERLSKSMGKGVLRRGLITSAQPLAEIARGLAPRGTDETQRMADTIAVSTKLSARQAKLHRKAFRNDKASVEVFVGPGPDPTAWNQEFGNENHGPQAFMRPAWDQDQKALLDRLSDALWAELQKTVKRLERRAARSG